MEDRGGHWNRLWGGLAVIAGIGLLFALEIADEPDLTRGRVLYELIEPSLIVMGVGGVVYLLQRTRRQQQEQRLLLRDLEVARAEGAKWRADMRELLRGLSKAIDAQFERWGLTQAEREVALLMLKGLSHKEIAAVRKTSERTIRQQARTIYSKANLSGRVALSAFFLEDLLLPIERHG